MDRGFSSNSFGSYHSDDNTPRDDRFVTPRAFASSQSSDCDYSTPRNQSGKYNSSKLTSDEDFDTSTPRDERFVTPRSPSSRTPRSSRFADDEFLYNSHNGSKDSYYCSYQRSDDLYVPAIAEVDEYHQEHQQDVLGVEEPVDAKDVDDLFRFARHGRCEEMERLLDMGIPVNVKDEYGSSLLITACQNGNKKVAKAVLRRGININGQNYKGNTALHYCYQFGYGDSLGQYLLSKGADASIRNYAGKLYFDGV